ncbi:NACHT domain-containing protein [Stenomitos frigidus]|uniref:NTPase (NACHT family) n=1 Tax=Stenomitos frigidus ULC18 TaxID=2107698 RepID=A0A2T1E9Y5_9CYAN|nr:NACHT domain-containing protein [Stenomitos frigidus]PSB29540.1 NTPase (NACHT family) [Stenomitos frigidus ULC18]
MLEWLLTIGATELGKAIFEQGLKLGQTAAEDYVKDFFKGCLKEGVAAAKPEVAKKAVAGALQAFLLLVTEELEDQELSKAEIRDRYDPALIQFVKDDLVKPILGQAFEKDCSAIDSAALATLWAQATLRGKPFPAMPEGFDWQRIGGEYLKKVRRIVRETPELRSLLETALLEDIARNTAHLNKQISPGFDVAKYRDSLQTSYGYLKLSTIDTTDQQYRVKLWKMFIEQTVREDLRQTSEVLKTSEVSESEALEHDRREYFQQPSRKVLEVINSQIPDFSEKSGISTGFSERGVILGDPGAGKSTLLQYLALEWVESQTSEVSKTSEVSARLPLLIELREYAIAQTNSFLEFLHRGRGVDWQFDQQQLHQYLQEHPTLVMFDGLDEVFDRPTQAAITDDIIRFAQQYPHAQILITSRIIGYSPERLQHAGFRHFTIQPLDTDEIHEFINRWYTLALGNDPDKDRLVTRLKEAISNSQAIRNLADNPLLLTMMAILNRRQELPRDRADLYDQASRVLLYHWDVDHKKLNLPLDTIGRREKQEMLRLIAYDMQAGEEGLKGNLISADRLTRILTDYLRDQGFSEPREKANKLIDQLRHRNFILCDRGADTYGFVHRTFLEYFCAVEIVHRFEKQRTLTFEQLRDEVFGNHWQDETWHETLRLVSSMLNVHFSSNIVDYLLEQNGENEEFANVFLAAHCFSEIKNRNSLSAISTKLFGCLEKLANYTGFDRLDDYKINVPAVSIIASLWKDDPIKLAWLKNFVLIAYRDNSRDQAIREIAKYWKYEIEILSWFKNIVEQSTFGFSVLITIFARISRDWKNDPNTLTWLMKCTKSENEEIRHVALQELALTWAKDQIALSSVTQLNLLDLNLLDLFLDSAAHDIDYWARRTALQALLTHYPTHPKTLELLRDRAENDPDEQLRQWAQEQLTQRSQQ